MTARAENLITDISLTPSTPEEVREGIAAWIRCVIGGLIVIDGIPLRCTRDGQLAITFPACADATTRRHPFIRPTDAAAGEVLVRAIADALKFLDEPEEAGSAHTPPE